ncbi:MAG: hypothetical protein AAGI11_03785 [Pseudomonadota bacterium]
MIEPRRQVNLDVSGTVDVTDPEAVTAALRGLLAEAYPGADLTIVDTLVADLARLYRGEYPGFRACDIPYHDIQHVLDVTLAMARLIVGHARDEARGPRLDAELAILGIACALFHDAGYIRRTHDRRHRNGAAYTRTHVGRSARFLREYLPTVGLTRLCELSAQLVHFTGYEQAIDEIPVADERQRLLGELLGTADLIAQMADADYLRKCRDRLYREFEAGGLAGEGVAAGYEGETYGSPEDLLASTPGFIEKTIRDRLDGAFHSVYRYAANCLEGRDLYMEAIEDNRSRLQAALAGHPA